MGPLLTLQATTKIKDKQRAACKFKTAHESSLHLDVVVEENLSAFSAGARPKFTKRNSMDSVELWKYSSDKVIFFFFFLISYLSCQYTTEENVILSPPPPEQTAAPL